MYSFELLRCLVPLDEELAALLAVHLKEVGVEVSRVRVQGLVAPLTSIFIIDFTDEPLVRLVTVPLQLLRQRCLYSSLKGLDLITIVDLVVKDLPLFDLTFVHLELLLLDALLTHDFLDPVFELDAGLATASIVRDTRVVLLVATDEECVLVVLIVQVIVARSNVSVDEAHPLNCAIEVSPHLADHLV